MNIAGIPIWRTVCSLLVLLAFSGRGFAADPSPNIVFLLADDLGYGDLGSYGGTAIRTPNLDRLANEGLRFTQAYSGGPVCTAARSVLMTGLHNGHTVARDNVPHYHTYLHDSDLTLAEVLQKAGYRCGGFGKWSLGDAHTEGRATAQGFDRWFGYLNQDHAHYYYPEYLDDDEQRLELTGNTEAREHYSHDLLTERALDFIRESKDAPFFFYGAYALPHFSARTEDPDGFTVPTTEPYSDRDWDLASKKYAAMVHMLDRDMGKITQLINDLGLRENTLIIFTSDNGGHRTIHERFDTNGPLRGYKRDLTEGGIRVPFIARWPGVVPAGRSSDQVIAFQDMLPTFAQLAGTTIPPDLGGISVLDALKGGSIDNQQRVLYWDYGHCRGNQYAQAVRLGVWKGIRSKKNGDVLELYNLANDLGETTNVADAHPKIVERIGELMDQAFTPDARYQVSTTYRGSARWKRGK
ncbi:arylsulfatase [Rhodopirellula europaea]|uniref:arylsulfatase n=1 Tax=Rhodopirellula europaea TaxID=1263866 RepID=UPI003D2D20C0|tara:strand:- start:39157 stop:40557 length:1401 start_codon:yes stop_codon:yes gene_type:complete